MGSHPRAAHLTATAAAVVAATVVLGVAPAAAADDAATASDCAAGLATPVSGAAAVARLGRDLDRVAADIAMTGPELATELRTDHGLRVDDCDRLLFVDSYTTPTGSPEPSTTPAGSDAIDVPGDAFTLHSRPGSTKVIYLDFTGHNSTGSAWNQGVPIDAPGYSIDSDPAFNADEITVIKTVWAAVAEDYAVFDVDVTTQEPAINDLVRSDWSDEAYGMRAVVTSSSDVRDLLCGYCAGVAYVGAFDEIGSRYQPAWALVTDVNTQPTSIATIVSHEVGHTVGLFHDGRNGYAYYGGNGLWGPLMGNPMRTPVTTWSNGDYPGATNTQDDTATIPEYGLTRLPDDHADTRAAATPVDQTVDGLIGTRNDVDWFHVPTTPGTPVRFTVATAAVNPNLDVELSVYDSAGTLIETVDPPAAVADVSTASGMSAATTLFTATDTGYYLRVDGVGLADPATGYSDYGSLGRYRVTVSHAGLTFGPTALPDATQYQPYAATLTVSGGTAPYRWAHVNGTLPPGVTVNRDGTVTGYPNQPGTFSFTVRATDSVGLHDTVTVTVTVPPRLLTLPNTTTYVSSGFVGTPYTKDLSEVYVSGGISPYTWTVAPGSSLPPGLTLTGNTVTGTPTTVGEHDTDFRIVDSVGNTGTGRIRFPIITTPTSGGGTSPGTSGVSPGPGTGGTPTGITVITTALPDGRVGVDYTAILSAYTNSGPPVTWTASTPLPAGLTLTPVGAIHGTPTVRGRYTVTLNASSGATTVTRTYPLTINNADGTPPGNTATPGAGLTITTTKVVARHGKKVRARFTATGATGPTTWTLIRGKAPNGTRVTPTGVLTGRPARPGTYTITVRVTDPANGATARRVVRVRVR